MKSIRASSRNDGDVTIPSAVKTRVLSLDVMSTDPKAEFIGGYARTAFEPLLIGENRLEINY